MLGAIGYYYNKPKHTEFVLHNFKNYYPNTSIVVINDGGSPELKNIAEHFQAKYIETTNLGFGDNLDDIEIMILWLERFFKAVEFIKEPYFIIMEDDVFITKYINLDSIMGEIYGLNENAKLPEKVTDYLKNYNNNITNTHVVYSGAGGCILKTDFFKSIAKEDWKTEIYTYAKLTKRFSKTEQSWYFNDCCLSFLCFRYGGNIIQNPEFIDLHVHPYRKDAAIIHHHHKIQFK